MKLMLGGPRWVGPVRTVRRRMMPWLELLMMRKQLMTLPDLAEGMGEAASEP